MQLSPKRLDDLSRFLDTVSSAARRHGFEIDAGLGMDDQGDHAEAFLLLGDVAAGAYVGRLEWRDVSGDKDAEQVRALCLVGEA